LVLVNTFPHYRKRLSLLASRIGARLIPRPILAWGRDRIAPAVLFGRLREESAVAAFRARMATWQLDAGYRARLRMVGRLDLRPRLGEIRQPTLLIAGTEDRIVDSLRQARVMQQVLPRATLETIEGGGHLILPLASVDWIDYLTEAHTAALERTGDPDA
ncbi:MAG: alpha/beta hydrolase, partial [Thermoanaerobaculia bacterium]|nr:alpha/beta hydrolase [Thermoanaerobaculia bacterium]